MEPKTKRTNKDQRELKKRSIFALSNQQTMQKTSPEISELKKRIENQLKRKVKTPNDFIFLSGAVWERTHETISSTSLKRPWGYFTTSFP